MGIKTFAELKNLPEVMADDDNISDCLPLEDDDHIGYQDGSNYFEVVYMNDGTYAKVKHTAEEG